MLASEWMFIFSTAHFDAKEAGDLSTLFDVGGIIGEALTCSAGGCLPCFSVGMQKEQAQQATGSREESCLECFLISAPALSKKEAFVFGSLQG